MPRPGFLVTMRNHGYCYGFFRLVQVKNFMLDQLTLNYSVAWLHTNLEVQRLKVLSHKHSFEYVVVMYVYLISYYLECSLVHY